jgi:hypothetical protein
VAGSGTFWRISRKSCLPLRSSANTWKLLRCTEAAPTSRVLAQAAAPPLSLQLQLRVASELSVS